MLEHWLNMMDWHFCLRRGTSVHQLANIANAPRRLLHLPCRRCHLALELLELNLVTIHLFLYQQFCCLWRAYFGSFAYNTLRVQWLAIQPEIKRYILRFSMSRSWFAKLSSSSCQVEISRSFKRSRDCSLSSLFNSLNVWIFVGPLGIWWNVSLPRLWTFPSSVMAVQKLADNIT